MKLHPRYDTVTLASNELSQGFTKLVSDVNSKYGLTFAELIGILAQIMQSWCKLEIRSEQGPQHE